MQRCQCARNHMAPADQFSLSDRGVQFKCCSTCRAAARTYMTQYGTPHCNHGKERTKCLVCNPASAFSKSTRDRAKKVLGTKLPVSTLQLLGCSSQHYAGYVAGKFRDSMTLANYGTVWVLDHIVPIMQRNVDGTRPDQQTIISRFNFTNVQPILIAEHRVKTIAEKVARFRPPPAPPPVLQLTDEEFDELMAALGIEM
jgi:hypothetical protein